MIMLGLFLFTIGSILGLIGIGTERQFFKILSVCILCVFIGVTFFSSSYKEEKKITIQEIETKMDSDGQYLKIKTYDNEYYYLNTRKMKEEIEDSSIITIEYLPFTYKEDSKGNKMIEIVEVK